jgi:hypothetical protein
VEENDYPDCIEKAVRQYMLKALKNTRTGTKLRTNQGKIPDQVHVLESVQEEV